jgi:hypothetical protein
MTVMVGDEEKSFQMVQMFSTTNVCAEEQTDEWAKEQ